MATATKPGVSGRKAKQKLPMVPMLLGVLCLMLLAAVIYLLMQDPGPDERERQLEMAVIQMAAAVESDAIVQEIFEDDEALSEAVDAVAAAITLQVSQNREAREALVEQRAAAERRVAELDMAMQQLRDNRDRMTELERELAEARQETAQLRETYESQLETVRSEKADVTAQLERAERRVRDTTPPTPETDVVVAPEPDVLEPEIETVKAPEPEPEPVAEIDGVMTRLMRGRSELFTHVWYDAETEQMLLETHDGKRLIYSELPEEVYSQLLEAASFDIFFRSRILRNFPSDPDDLKVVRSVRRRR